MAKSVIYSHGEIVDIDSILANQIISHGDIELLMEKICNTEIPFVDLKDALDNKILSKKSINRALDRVRAKYEGA